MVIHCIHLIYISPSSLSSLSPLLSFALWVSLVLVLTLLLSAQLYCHLLIAVRTLSCCFVCTYASLSFVLRKMICDNTRCVPSILRLGMYQSDVCVHIQPAHDDYLWYMIRFIPKWTDCSPKAHFLCVRLCACAVLQLSLTQTEFLQLLSGRLLNHFLGIQQLRWWRLMVLLTVF